MQFPRLEMLLLILFASSSLTATGKGRERGERVGCGCGGFAVRACGCLAAYLTPSNPDLHTLSEPARSTIDRTERLTLVVEEEAAEVVLPAHDGVR